MILFFFFQSRKLVAFLAPAILLLSSNVTATETSPDLFIELPKPVYFMTIRGEPVHIQPGSYQVAPQADSLEIRSTTLPTPILLAATFDTHEQELTEPVAVSVAGIPEDDSADRHVLALFLPGGLVYQTEGTYSGIRPRSIEPQSLITDPMNIYLEKPVHFLSPEGNDLLTQPGIYTVEAAGQGIRLIPGDGQDAIFLKAGQDKHDGSLDIPIALSLPGDAEEEADLHYVVLLLSDGQSLLAAGTYSGIHRRGLFGNFVKKTVKKAKRTVNHVGQGAKRTTQQIGKGIKRTGQDAGRFAQKAALEAKKKAEWAAQQAAKGALLAAKAMCKAGLTAARVTAELQAKLLGPLKTALENALKLDKAQQALRQAVEQIKQQQGPAIQQAIQAGLILTHPNNAKAVKQMLDPNQMCERPAATVQRTMQNMIGQPLRAALTASHTADRSGVRSRGTFASASIGFGGNLAKVGGGELGVSYAFDFVNQPHWYLDLAGMLKSNVGGGGGVAIGIFPRVNPDNVGGWFLGVGVGVPFPHPKLAKAMDAGVDVFFDFPLRIEKPFKPQWDLTSPKFFLDHFQGFAVGVGAGKSAVPVDIALKAGAGIRLSKVR